MSLKDRSLIFRAVVEAYSNDFSNSGKHSPRFIKQAVMDEATKPGLKADPRMTSTDLGAVAAGVGKHLMTHEGLCKDFVDMEISGVGLVATFLKGAKPNMVAENLNGVGQVSRICQPGDTIGEGIIADVLIVAIDPTPAVVEACVSTFKESLTEGRLDEKWWNTAIQRIKGAYKALTTATHHIVTTKLNPEATQSDITALHAKARSIGGGSYMHSKDPADMAPEAMRRSSEGEVIHAFHNAADAKTFAAHAKSEGHSPKVGGAVKANPNTKVESKESPVTAFTEAQADEIAGPLSLLIEEVSFSHELVVHKSAIPHEVLVKHLQSWNAASPQRAGIAKARGTAGTRVLFKSDKHANMFKHTLAGRHEDPDAALEGMHVKPIHEAAIAAAKALESQQVTVRVTTLANHPGATKTHAVAERLSASSGKVVSEGVKEYIFASSKAAETFLIEAEAVYAGPRHAKVEIVAASVVEMAKHNHPITHEAVASTASSFAPSVHVEDKGHSSHISGAKDGKALAEHLKQKFPHATVGVMQSPVRGEYVHVSHGAHKVEAAQVDEAEVGKIDKAAWAKAEAAAVKQYGAEMREKDSDKFYAITMSIYKKMKHVDEAIAELGESGEVKTPEYHQKRIDHIQWLIDDLGDDADDDKVKLGQHLDLEKDRLKRSKAKVNESETVDHPILRLHAHATGTIAEGRSPKAILKSMMSNFALPGVPGAKNETGNVGFDTAFKSAIAAAKTRNGIIAESEYATLVDDIAFALVEHFGDEADKTLAEAVVPEFKAPLHESAGPNPATLQQIAKALLLSADVVPESLTESIQSWRDHAATLPA